MVDWEVALALGASGLTFVLWVITTYLSFFKTRPKLVVKAPRYVEKNNEWAIYVYNEGNRSTRMLEQETYLIAKEGRTKTIIYGKFRPADRVDYFVAGPGAYHNFYTIYERTILDDLFEGMKARIYLEMKYDNGRKTKRYKKKIKLDQEDFEKYREKSEQEDINCND